jgi:acyl-coenzyme A thioesterase PaaI-like protein
MNSNRIPIPILEGHDCFACGTNNPIGLKLRFYRQDNYICSNVTLTRNHVGWQNMAHGGIISTLLDEVMSWTVIYFKKSFSVTRRMGVRYLRPVPVEVPLTVKGMIISDEGQRRCQAQSLLQDDKENVLAKGEADFAILSADRLKDFPEKFKKQMMELFKRYE